MCENAKVKDAAAATRPRQVYDRITGHPADVVDVAMNVPIDHITFDALKAALLAAGHEDLIQDYARVIATSEVRLKRAIA